MASAITNMEIEALAKGIGINQKLDGLGLKLGYEYETIDVYKARNHSDAKVTYQGTKQMLRDWRDEITQEELQRPILKKALEDAGLARLAEKYLGGEAAMGTGQAGRSEKLSERPRTQTQTGGTNSITASGHSNVSGNNVIGHQTNNYNSAPSTPAVHHHHNITNNVNQASPARPVIPPPAARKRRINTSPGPAPKRPKVTESGPNSKAKSPGKLPNVTKKKVTTKKADEKKARAKTAAEKKAKAKTAAEKKAKAKTAAKKKATKKAATKKKATKKAATKKKATKKKAPTKKATKKKTTKKKATK